MLTKFILIVIMSLPYGGNSLVHTQEFDSLDACKKASMVIAQNAKNTKTFCVEQ